MEHLGREALHPYQRELHDFMLENPFSYVLADMGLGKTLVSLTLLDTLMRDFDPNEIQHALIVAPLRVARNTWPREIAKWLHTQAWPYTLLRMDDDDPKVREAYKREYDAYRSIGLSAKDAAGLAKKDATRVKNDLRDVLRLKLRPITIINQEAVPWLVKSWGKKWPYDALIFDEATRLRDYKSEVFDSLKFVRPRFKRIYLLTATPTADSLMPLFSMTYMLDGGQRFGKFITKFRARYFDENRYTHEFTPREGAREEMMQKIADISIVMKESDHFDVEEPLFIPRYVEMTEEEKKRYDDFEESLILALPDGGEVLADNAAALAQKLLQLGSGTVYDVRLEETDDPDVLKKVRHTHVLHRHKIEDLKTFMEEVGGEPVLVAYWSKASLALLKEAFPKIEVLDRKASQEKRWNQRRIPMLAIHPDGGAHGLNLQDGGHHIYLFDLWHRAELYLQLVKRLARQGQKHRVKVHGAITRGTLDERAIRRLRGKEESHHDFMAELRNRIRVIRQKRRR